jgi:hypothetical protein
LICKTCAFYCYLLIEYFRFKNTWEASGKLNLNLMVGTYLIDKDKRNYKVKNPIAYFED